MLAAVAGIGFLVIVFAALVIVLLRDPADDLPPPPDPNRHEDAIRKLTGGAGNREGKEL